MTWITTATGSEVSLRNPEPASISLRTIAHHLSLINRFTGATCRPYSVAEHSLLVCEIAEREFQLDAHGLLAALLLAAHCSVIQHNIVMLVAANGHALLGELHRLLDDAFTHDE